MIDVKMVTVNRSCFEQLFMDACTLEADQCFKERPLLILRASVIDDRRTSECITKFTNDKAMNVQMLEEEVAAQLDASTEGEPAQEEATPAQLWIGCIEKSITERSLEELEDLMEEVDLTKQLVNYSPEAREFLKFGDFLFDVVKFNDRILSKEAVTLATTFIHKVQLYELSQRTIWYPITAELIAARIKCPRIEPNCFEEAEELIRSYCRDPHWEQFWRSIEEQNIRDGYRSSKKRIFPRRIIMKMEVFYGTLSFSCCPLI
ncbi:unnamed protein product [Caenorhabditis nigoni]